MRFLIYSDVHFCENSSIVRSFGERFSTRLENLIASVSWAEEQAIINNCDEIICLGDFFNKPDLNSRELTALQEVRWSNLPHTFLVGNHDASDKSLRYNSVTALASNGFSIITQPLLKKAGNFSLLFLPYIMEQDRVRICDYAENIDKEHLYVFSHNDIEGLQYGPFISKEGFSISDIENSCRIFLNGHLHNGEVFCKNGINIGNLTGQNFSEDATKYEHNIAILDTDDNSLIFIENPFALNFYKLDYTSTDERNYCFELKENSVLSIRCKSHQSDYIRSALASCSTAIVEARIVVVPEIIGADAVEEKIKSYVNIDHKSKFIDFCMKNLTPSDILVSELQEVCK